MESRNIYDFRRSNWYVSAATSPKDIIILIDSSSSTTQKKISIARAIVEAILNTLSNDDFVNVFKFAASTKETINCFKDLLVQVNIQ